MPLRLDWMDERGLAQTGRAFEMWRPREYPCTSTTCQRAGSKPSLLLAQLQYDKVALVTS